VRLDSYSGSTPTYSNGVRRHPRVLYSVPIQISHLGRGGVRNSHGLSLDISEAGLGALVQGEMRMGEAVEIEVPLPGHRLKTVAIVRHASIMCSGFEFLGLTAEERLRIARLAGTAGIAAED